MKTRFLSALLCGAAVLSAGTFVSCNNEIDELESRVSVLEGYIAEIKAKLENALTTGASIVSYTQDEKGGWTFNLSDGGEIRIAAGSTSQGGGSSSGGSSIEVIPGEGNFTIIVDGTSYVIPTGAKVNSFVYVPEYIDGKVILGNDGATVKFLATPAVSSVEGATFGIAVANELKTRAGSLMKVVKAEVKDAYVVVTLKGLAVEAGKSYTTAVSMTMAGTQITSDCFTVEVSEDFEFESEAIGGFTIKSEYKPTEVDADGFCQMTVVGSKLLADGLNLSAFFDALPENAKFMAAPNLNQPGGKAQELSALLESSIKEDGSFAWSSRPGTAFNENTERPGFLVYVTSDDVIKAKVYVVINDELAGLEEAFKGGRTGNFEAEWGGREKALELGVNTIDVCKVLTEYSTEIPIIHNGGDDQSGWFKKWVDYSVQTASEDIVIFNDGGKLKMSELAATYAKGCRGIYWFYRGFAIYVPEALATDGKFVADNGEEFSAGEGYGVDMWMGQYNEYINNASSWYNNCSQYGITLSEDGILTTSETYTGFGVRLAFDGGYEYAYGVYPFHGEGADQCGMLFFNRRVAPAGAKMPSKL